MMIGNYSKYGPNNKLYEQLLSVQETLRSVFFFLFSRHNNNTRSKYYSELARVGQSLGHRDRKRLL